MTKIYSCFSGSGKSYYANNTDKSVVDLESTFYRYKNMTKKTIEHMKGCTNREINPNFVDDYVKAIEEQIENKTEILFISQHDEVLSELDNKGIDYTIVFYQEDMLEECLDRCRKRGNTESFVNGIKEKWDYFCNKYITENSILLSKDKPYISNHLEENQ